MRKIAVLVLGLALALGASAAAAQQTQQRQGTQGTQTPSTGNPIPPAQSLQPTPSACSAGSQSLRVCNNDFQSCSSVCTATALDPNADVAGCSTRCCSQFKACLSIRGLHFEQCELLLSRLASRPLGASLDLRELFLQHRRRQVAHEGLLFPGDIIVDLEHQPAEGVNHLLRRHALLL
jgi:hypothetical protein